MSSELPEEDLQDVRQLLIQGKKIDAIKRYRELTGLGLAEAKAAIERLQGGSPGNAPAPRGEVPEEELEAIKQLVFEHRKLDAIKHYRQATGVDLKHAKDVIDGLQERLREESPERFLPLVEGRGHGLWLIFGLVVLGMIIFAIVRMIGAPVKP
jgi:ribosomal protein L7/L12